LSNLIFTKYKIDVECFQLCTGCHSSDTRFKEQWDLEYQGAAGEENVQTTGGGVFRGEGGGSGLNDKGDIVPSVRGVIKNCLDGFCGFDFNAKTVFPIFPPYPCACLFSTNR